MQLLVKILALSALCAAGTAVYGADEKAAATAAEKTFITKAAIGGMTEVQLGKIAAENGGSEAVKDFGEMMVKDHSKANEELKEVAAKMGVEVPAKVDADHEAMIEKMSSMSGAAFDNAYVPQMVKAHKKDISEFQEAQKMAKNEELKEFIEETILVLEKHLEKIQTFDQAK